MEKIKKLLMLIFLTAFFINCSSIENPVQTMKAPQKSNLTLGTVKSKIIENKTTQEEVMTLLGAPNLVTKNSKGNEVWNYNRMAFESGAYGESQSRSGVGIGGTGGSSGILGGLFGTSSSKSSVVASSTTSSFDLILIFNNKDIVESYKVIQASF